MTTVNAQNNPYNKDTGDRVLRYVQLQVDKDTGGVCLSLVWNANTVKGCHPQLSRLVKSLRGGEGGRGHWGGLKEEFLERNMGTFKFWGGQCCICQEGVMMELS